MGGKEGVSPAPLTGSGNAQAGGDAAQGREVFAYTWRDKSFEGVQEGKLANPSLLT